jgi:hypothetical protein
MWISHWISEGAINEEDLLTKLWALALSQLNSGVEIHVDPTNEATRESLSVCGMICRVFIQKAQTCIPEVDGHFSCGVVGGRKQNVRELPCSEFNMPT